MGRRDLRLPIIWLVEVLDFVLSVCCRVRAGQPVEDYILLLIIKLMRSDPVLLLNFSNGLRLEFCQVYRAPIFSQLSCKIIFMHLKSVVN